MRVEAFCSRCNGSRWLRGQGWIVVPCPFFLEETETRHGDVASRSTRGADRPKWWVEKGGPGTGARGHEDTAGRDVGGSDIVSYTHRIDLGGRAYRRAEDRYCR